jgi:D-2-hydroxyacid dehydrogenase (NADP+)
MFPPKDRLTICFAHAAYQLQERFQRRQLSIHSFGVRTLGEFERRIGEADVVVVSGMWRNDLLDRAQRLRFIQSISAGTDQFDRSKLAERGIRLASAQGVNVQAVSEHAMALMLALTRKLPEARDNQAGHVWRGMISDSTQREDELSGKTLLIIGLGGIGSRLAQLAKAFGLRVIGIKRNPATGGEAADSAHALTDEAICLSRQRGTWPMRGRTRADQSASRPDDRRSRNRRHRGRAAAGDLTALGLEHCADHAAYGRRNAEVRGHCAGHSG